MTTYALDARTTNRSALEETPLRFRAYSAVYAALAVLVLAFLALLPVVALA